jgi:phospholipase C
MGFYNAEQEQVSVFKALADRFTLSDNYHQPVLGGTAVQHVMLGTADAIFWSDGKGNPAIPPASQIANPNPLSGTVNRYTADNNFSKCSDVTQPGVQPIVDYINSLPYPAEPNCQEDAYYMLDNTIPGFLPNGALSGTGNVPPSSVRTIGDALIEKNISWAYFGGAYNDAVILSNEAVAANPTSPNLSTAALADPAHALGTAYCQICNPFQYATSIMSNTAVRTAHIKDTSDLIADIKNNTLRSRMANQTACSMAIHQVPNTISSSPMSSTCSMRSKPTRRSRPPQPCSSPLTKLVDIGTPATFSLWTFSATDRAFLFWSSRPIQPAARSTTVIPIMPQS